MKKLLLGTIPEIYAKAVRTVVDNVVVLLQKTTLKATVQQEKMPQQPSLPAPLDISKYGEPLKIQIAQTIINHFKDINRELCQEILDSLVDS